MWPAANDGTIAFLRENRRAILITLRKDGSPTGHPMGAFFGVNGLFFNTYAKSAKARNIRRNPNICCLVASFAAPRERQFALVRGVARFVPNEETEEFGDQDGRRIARLGSSQSNRGGPKDEDPAEAQRRLDRAAQRVAEGKRVVFELLPNEIGTPAPGRSRPIP
jgi:pyridoxine/pyridoxamine 5'-phosphate oxidase